MTAGRDHPPQVLARSDITTAHSPATSTASFRHEMSGPPTLGPIDYFPGVIDTSTYNVNRLPKFPCTNLRRSMGPEGL
jgi:hypothetical protein